MFHRINALRSNYSCKTLISNIFYKKNGRTAGATVRPRVVRRSSTWPYLAIAFIESDITRIVRPTIAKSTLQTSGMPTVCLPSLMEYTPNPPTNVQTVPILIHLFNFFCIAPCSIREILARVFQDQRSHRYYIYPTIFT